MLYVRQKLMHTASRILTKEATTDNGDVIRERIHSCLVSALGVSKIKSLEAHLKGGFVFTAEIEKEQAENFVDYVEQAGFMFGV